MENRKGNVRGKYARFINENPRFINEPIYNISYTIDSRASVSDCMKWTTNENKKNHKKNVVQLPPPIIPVKHHRAPKTTIEIVLAPENTSPSVKKELISFKHQYDCRKDPNEPIRGKLHGSFVCELT